MDVNLCEHEVFRHFEEGLGHGTFLRRGVWKAQPRLLSQRCYCAEKSTRSVLSSILPYSFSNAMLKSKVWHEKRTEEDPVCDRAQRKRVARDMLQTTRDGTRGDIVTTMGNNGDCLTHALFFHALPYIPRLASLGSVPQLP